MIFGARGSSLHFLHCEERPELDLLQTIIKHALDIEHVWYSLLHEHTLAITTQRKLHQHLSSRLLSDQLVNNGGEPTLKHNLPAGAGPSTSVQAAIESLQSWKEQEELRQASWVTEEEAERTIPACQPASS